MANKRDSSESIPVDRGAEPMSVRSINTTQPSVEIIETVASATGRDACELPRLHESVDPEAIDTLLAPDANTPRGGVHISFEYAGVGVTAERDGGLEIELNPVGSVGN